MGVSQGVDPSVALVDIAFAITPVVGFVGDLGCISPSVDLVDVAFIVGTLQGLVRFAIGSHPGLGDSSALRTCSVVRGVDMHVGLCLGLSPLRLFGENGNVSSLGGLGGESRVRSALLWRGGNGGLRGEDGGVGAGTSGLGGDEAGVG